jgi:hypothetical protein
MSTAINDADVDADDALQDLLDETDNMMHDLDIHSDGGIDFQDFAIDSDDEVDDFEGGLNSNDDNDDNNSSVDHPLSEEWLSARAASATTPTTPSLLLSANNNNNGGIQHPATNNPMVNGIGMVDSSTTSMGLGGNMDVWKQQTSQFASNFASMAQRAASQVAQAGQVVASTAVPAVTAAAMNAIQPPQQFPVAGGMQQQPLPSPISTSNTHAIPQQQQQQQQQYPSNELDKEQKDRLFHGHAGDLLPGERVIMFLSNLLHVSDSSGLSYAANQQQQSSSSSSEPYMWCCAMSYYRLILFSTAEPAQLEVPPPKEWAELCWPKCPNSITKLEIPLASMGRVEKTVYQAAGSSYMGLVITAKDCGRILRFTTPSYTDTGRAFESLNTYAFPGRRNLGYLFAFESKRQRVMDSVLVEDNGQQKITIPPTPRRFDPMMEYPRLLASTSTTQSPWIMWASSNSTYQLSPTYPSVLVGPATIDETKLETQHIIRQCAAFRSEQRLPCMTWCGVGGASIWRSSQPKVGLQGNRSPADELYLRHICESARGANAIAEPPINYPRNMLQQLTGDYSKDWVPEPACGLKIMDLRPRSAAMANRTGGEKRSVNRE